MVSLLGGTIFHSSVWARYSRAVQTNLTELYVTCVNEEGAAVGAALVFVENSRNRIVNLFTKRMLLFAAPAANDDNAVLHEIILKLEEYCRKKGFVQLSIYSYASADISEQLIKGEYDLTSRYEFILDLDRSEEQLWIGMERKLRQSINKAKKIGVTIHEFPDEESIAALDQLQDSTADRILSSKGIDIHRSRTRTADPVAIILEAGAGRIFSAVVDEEIVSASLFTVFNGKVYHTLSGANTKALKTEAPKLLIWDAITKFKACKARSFNLSGCKMDARDPDSSEYGVYNFKKKFGADMAECASGEKIIGGKRAGLFNLVRSVTR